MTRYLFLFSCMLTTACVSFQPVVPEKIEKIRINHADARGIDLDIDLKINNPNNHKVKVRYMQLKLTVNDIPAGNIEVQKDIVIPANTKSIQHVNVQGSLEIVGPNSLPLVVKEITKKELEVKGEGEIKASYLIFRKSFPISFTEKMKL